MSMEIILCPVSVSGSPIELDICLRCGQHIRIEVIFHLPAVLLT